MTENSRITQEMRDAIGVESEPVTYEVERGAVKKFAEAIGDPNPLFNDEAAARKTRHGGLIAPPTFLRWMGPRPAKVDMTGAGSVRLDGGSEWEYFEPVRPGDRITVTSSIADIHERQGCVGIMLFVVTEISYVNQFGSTVALQRVTGIRYDPPEEKS